MKHYKPGQFVSIGGTLARVCKHTLPSMCTCIICAESNKWMWRGCDLNALGKKECNKKLGLNLYPKLIKQCEKQEK